MKKTLVLSLSFLLTGLFVFSQTNPVRWTFSSRKVADKIYEVTMTANVPSPWHIYSQTTPEGGPIATKITYNKNPLLLLDGTAGESGKIITKREDVFDMNVVYFDGAANFVQKVKLKNNAKTNLSGSIQFMVCNDTQCLPPTDVPFSVALN